MGSVHFLLVAWDSHMWHRLFGFKTYKKKCIFDTKLSYLWRSIGDFCYYQSSIWLNEGGFHAPWSLVFLINITRILMVSLWKVCWICMTKWDGAVSLWKLCRGVFLVPLVSMNPGEWSVANDKFLLDFFPPIFINLWIDIISIKMILTAPMKKMWGL